MSPNILEQADTKQRPLPTDAWCLTHMDVSDCLHAIGSGLHVAVYSQPAA